jgi:hypothetical protein
MKDHALHSAEGNVSLQVKPAYQSKSTTLFARCREHLLCNVLPTLLIAVGVSSLTLLLCEQIDKAKHAREVQPAISTLETQQKIAFTDQETPERRRSL